MNKQYRRIVCKDDAEWLAVRRQGIGGSDVAAIMGLSKWRTPYQVWAEKRGEVEPEDISGKPAVMWGNLLETPILEHYKALHPERNAHKVHAIMQCRERPWAQASLDGEFYDPELYEWGVLEIKTAGQYAAKDWETGVPIYYQTQVQHYLSVTGRGVADVAVLIAGQDYREYRIERDEEDIAAIDRAVDEFWQMVKDGTEPELCAADAQTVTERYAEGHGLAEADKRTCDLVTIWLNHEQRAKEEQSIAKEYKTKVKNRIGDAEGLIIPGKGRLTWGRGVYRALDTKRLRAERPELYKEYTVERTKDMGLRFKPDGELE